jgi:division protein CdvB (Snf7/Vps24/ESCRT-III family)
MKSETVGMNSKWVKSESVLDSNERDIHNNNNNNNSQMYPLPKPGGPLKPRLDAVQKKIEVQVRRLEELRSIHGLKDCEVFTKFTDSLNENNTQHLTILSSELTKSRQIARVLLLSSASLEKLTSKISSASDFGNLVMVLSPAMAVIKNLRSSITPFVPEMEEEFGIISELLSGILVDAGQVGGFTIDFEKANEQAAQFLADVSEVVDQKMKEEFSKVPELPVIPIGFL